MIKKNVPNAGTGHKRIRAALILCTVFVSCANGSNGYDPKGIDSNTASEEEIERALDRNRKIALPKPTSNQSKVNNFKKIYDFQKNLSAAHLRSGGLLMDFGTVARYKYTLGDWKTGFQGAVSENGTTFSYMSSRVARIFFDAFLSESEGGRAVFRVRGHGSKQAAIYLNGEPLGAVELPVGEFGYASLEIKDRIVPGQNELMIRCKRTSRLSGGGRAALALDYVRIIPHKAHSGPAAASYDAVRFPNPAGGVDQLVLAAGESLTFNLPVPEGARLRGSMYNRVTGQVGRLEVTAQHGHGTEMGLAEVDVGSGSQTMNLDLHKLSGQMIGLTLRVTRGEVVLRDFGLFVSKTEEAKAPGVFKARNFILVLIDTLRADRLALYNRHTRVQTEHLDALGAESMVFDKALAPENWTKPSIASMLSGIYPATHKTQDDRSRLPSTVVIAPEHFQKLGFETAGFVANGYVSNKFGFRRGWDTWTNYVREGKRNRAKYVMDDAVHWLESRANDKPFFLYVHTIDPHVPYIPPKKYWSLYDPGPYSGPVQPAETARLLEKVKSGKQLLSDRDKRRLEALYDGEITYHDDQMARLYQTLQTLELLDDTLIIVTSDHGEEFFEHGKVGHGHSLYEELLHVPLLVRLPQASPGDGTHSATEVSLVDILPTACQILGVECPAAIEGRSLKPLLQGHAFERFPAASFAEFMRGQRAVRMGPFKAIYKGHFPSVYDLSKDPKETRNIAREQPVVLSGLRDALGRQLGRFTDSRTPTSKKRASRHRAEEVTIDPETRRQLRALGYLGDE